MESLKSFTIKLAAVSVFMEALMLLWFYFAKLEYVSAAMPFIPPFFMAFTFIMHKVIYATRDQEFKYFQRKFMLMTTIKILLLLFIIMIYVFFKTDEAIQFTLAFFANYLVYTIFEARALLLRNKQE
jgi:hypothetical protein